MKKSILLVNYDKRWGGGQEYLICLINGLLKNNFQVGQLIAPNSVSAERFAQTFINEKNYQPHIVLRRNFFELKKVISQYQILHIHREHDLWLSLFANWQTKKIFSEHIKPIKKRWLLKFFDEFICNSGYVQAEFEKIYKYKSKIIYPAISLEQIQNNTKTQLEGKPKIFMSAAFHKNQSELVEIFELIQKQLPLARLYFIGPSAETKALNSLKDFIQSKKLNHKITILPSVPRNEYLSILNQIDIFAYTYTEEAFGLAALEAALLNKNIIAYKAGGLIDVLENYPKATLIEPQNKKDFALAIEKIHQKTDQAIDISALKNKFSLNQLIEKHLNCYL